MLLGNAAARIVQLLVERVDVQEDAIEVRIRAEGLASESGLDGGTLVVRIPLRFQRRGGRKRIVAPDGSEIAPTMKPQPDGTLGKALARAHRWRGLLESGKYGTLAELADAERISRSYVCRVLRLTLLAPDIVERILDGRPTAGLPQLLKPFPVEWERQREQLC